MVHEGVCKKNMKLWTVMSKTVYEDTIIKNGIYSCDTDKCDMLINDIEDKYYENAYNWLADYMNYKIGKPNNKNTKYPVWAWYKLRGKKSRPDLRWVEFKGYKEPMVLIECEIDDNKVVLSDEVKWTVSALNNIPYCYTDEELEWYWDNHKIPNKDKELFKYNSWIRIFDIAESEHIQATFRELRKEDIIKVTEFNK